MEGVKESIIGFFYDSDSGWPTTGFLFLLEIFALVGYFNLQKRSRIKKKNL